ELARATGYEARPLVAAGEMFAGTSIRRVVTHPSTGKVADRLLTPEKAGRPGNRDGDRPRRRNSRCSADPLARVGDGSHHLPPSLVGQAAKPRALPSALTHSEHNQGSASRGSDCDRGGRADPVPRVTHGGHLPVRKLLEGRLLHLREPHLEPVA